jgi:hypothetical protein
MKIESRCASSSEAELSNCREDFWPDYSIVLLTFRRPFATRCHGSGTYCHPVLGLSICGDPNISIACCTTNSRIHDQSIVRA